MEFRPNPYLVYKRYGKRKKADSSLRISQCYYVPDDIPFYKPSRDKHSNKSRKNYVKANRSIDNIKLRDIDNLEYLKRAPKLAGISKRSQFKNPKRLSKIKFKKHFGRRNNYIQNSIQPFVPESSFDYSDFKEVGYGFKYNGHTRNLSRFSQYSSLDHRATPLSMSPTNQRSIPTSIRNKFVNSSCSIPRYEGNICWCFKLALLAKKIIFCYQIKRCKLPQKKVKNVKIKITKLKNEESKGDQTRVEEMIKQLIEKNPYKVNHLKDKIHKLHSKCKKS
ncbi:unnamed protein product [Moneuplotes crassus]|uniref:Uncharacterized protein n=1 Tax=Euplotes crassus TaxID=5936 RepID=A0AAD1UKC5_EUPCR|nr:unnamed protein product [Moneuplotes crassus]